MFIHPQCDLFLADLKLLSFGRCRNVIVTDGSELFQYKWCLVTERIFDWTTKNYACMKIVSLTQEVALAYTNISLPLAFQLSFSVFWPPHFSERSSNFSALESEKSAWIHTLPSVGVKWNTTCYVRKLLTRIFGKQVTRRSQKTKLNCFILGSINTGFRFSALEVYKIQTHDVTCITLYLCVGNLPASYAGYKRSRTIWISSVRLLLNYSFKLTGLSCVSCTR